MRPTWWRPAFGHGRGWPISIPPVTSFMVGDVLIFFVEEVHTGLVQRAEREHRDGVVVLRP